MQKKGADKYEMPSLKQIHLYLVPVMNYETGGAELRNWRRTSNRCSFATNASMKILLIENSCPHSDYSKKYTSSGVRAILKALEARKVKLSCFKGIVDPTDIHGSWGT